MSESAPIEHSFSSLKLPANLLDNLATLNFSTMTPIQAQSLPPILEGKDVIAQAQTGSGKTAAFGLGLLAKLKVKRFRIQTLILCPTRELANQVADDIRKLARNIHNIKILTLCGGVPLGPQIGSLEHGAHIIVGTPGRVQDHLDKRTLLLENVDTLILDEADRMLEMGFQDTLDAIIAQVPSGRQTLLFSATYPTQIESVAQRIMRDPVMIKVAPKHDDTSIEQLFFSISEEQRIQALRLILLEHERESTIIFCNTKSDVADVTYALGDFGFSVQALHGDLEQRERDQTLIQFANKSISIVVATDVAARGLDINALDLVVNFQIARESDVHTHRVGRTGRAGSTGLACTLHTEKERYKITKIEEQLGHTINSQALPSRSLLKKTPIQPSMATIKINGGKKQKLRAGDILGALTGDKSISGKAVGKINLFDNWAYVAIDREFMKLALKKLGQGKMKGRTFKIKLME